MLNVGRSGHFGWSLVILRVLPEILEPGLLLATHTYSGIVESLLIRGFHLRASDRRAELGNGSIEQVNLIVEIDHWGKVIVVRKKKKKKKPSSTADGHYTHH